MNEFYNEISKKTGFTCPYISSYPIRVIYDGKIRMIFTEGMLVHNYPWLTKIHTDDTYYFTILPFNPSLHQFKCEKELLDHMKIPADHFIVLCNTMEQVEFCGQAGMRGIFCNHNAFHDPKIFYPTGIPKKYDAVMITRPMLWKRPNLAAKVGNLAVIRSITHSTDVGGQEYDLMKLNPAYINDKFLGPVDVAGIINQSRVGMILSANEGANYATIEYLMCGIPVVSTRSVGGRDVWYDEVNSIVVDMAIPDTVKIAVDKLKDNRRWEVSQIVLDTLRRMDEHLGRFKAEVAGIFERNGIAEDVEGWYAGIYRHQMKEYVDSSEGNVGRFKR